MTTKQNVLFIAGTVAIVFVGTFIGQPAVIQWLGRHPIYDALITSLGIAFHALNTYLPRPIPQAQQGQNLPQTKA